MSSLSITRTRGDTYSEFIDITSTSGASKVVKVVDVTGCSFLLTVDPEKAPLTSDNNLFSITGVIYGDPKTGVVEFPVSDIEAATPPGGYFYDIQMIDAAGKKRTIVLDKWTVTQDISK